MLKSCWHEQKYEIKNYDTISKRLYAVFTGTFVSLLLQMPATNDFHKKTLVEVNWRQISSY